MVAAPCRLILDDLERADPASLELIHYFLSAVPRMRILLLATLNDVRVAGARGHASTSKRLSP